MNWGVNKLTCRKVDQGLFLKRGVLSISPSKAALQNLSAGTVEGVDPTNVMHTMLVLELAQRLNNVAQGLKFGCWFPESIVLYKHSLVILAKYRSTMQVGGHPAPELAKSGHATDGGFADPLTDESLDMKLLSGLSEATLYARGDLVEATRFALCMMVLARKLGSERHVDQATGILLDIRQATLGEHDYPHEKRVHKHPSEILERAEAIDGALAIMRAQWEGLMLSDAVFDLGLQRWQALKRHPEARLVK